MYKLAAVLPLIFAAVSAGYIGEPISHGGLSYSHAAPVALTIAHAPIAVAHAPVAVAHAPAATSWSNQVRIVSHSVPVTKTVVSHAPIAVAHVAHAPALTLSHGHSELYH